MPYYTESGQYIRNPEAYANTGAPMFESRESNININEPTSIYIAHLEKGKKYVGKTIDFERRSEQHFNGEGSKVTQKFKPYKIEEVEIVPGFFSDEVEQELTEELIEEYGYENIRGGMYTNSKTLKNEYTCYICGKHGHFARDCYNKP